MTRLINRLFRDEAGFVVSSEMVLIATIGVLAMVVGLSELALNINNELEDVASAFGASSQSFRVNGASGHGGSSSGGSFGDGLDFCDRSGSIRPGDTQGEH